MSEKYKRVKVCNHPLFPGRRQVLRNRLVMAESLGRPLLRSEHIHHKDEDTLNNRRKNLKIMLHGKHTTHHKLDSHHSIEAKKKMSLAHKGKIFTAEHKHNLSLAREGKKPMLGKHFTAEAKKKMSLAHKGHPPTPGMLGKYHTAKTRKRMSLIQKDRRREEKESHF